jgi:hypothetical protein
VENNKKPIAHLFNSTWGSKRWNDSATNFGGVTTTSNARFQCFLPHENSSHVKVCIQHHKAANFLTLHSGFCIYFSYQTYICRTRVLRSRNRRLWSSQFLIRGSSSREL